MVAAMDEKQMKMLAVVESDRAVRLSCGHPQGDLHDQRHRIAIQRHSQADAQTQAMST